MDRVRSPSVTAVATLLKSGQRVILPDDLYTNTHRLFTQLLPDKEIRPDFVDLTDPALAAGALGAPAGMLWLESPTNPSMKVLDIAALAGLARAKGVPTVVDNSYCSPYFQRPLDLGDRHPLGPGQMPDDRRVDVARARAHHEPFQRCEPHRRVDRTAVLDRHGRGAVAQVQRDERCGRLARAGESAVAVEHGPVRDPVESESADPVAVRQLPRNRVAPRALRQRGVKCRVEDGDHRQLPPERGATAPDAGEARRIVERRECFELLDPPQRRAIDQSGLGEPCAAMDHPVTDRVDPAPRIDFGEPRGHAPDGGALIPDRLVSVDLRAAVRIEPDRRPVAEPVDLAAHQRAERSVGLPLEEAELERRAPAVEREDDHRCLRGALSLPVFRARGLLRRDPAVQTEE